MQTSPPPNGPVDSAAIELPEPTAAPLVLALGMTLLAAGVAFGLAFLVCGAVLIAAGFRIWIGQLLPGRGHVHEPLAEPGQRSRAIVAAPGGVARLAPGVPGYRLRLPKEIHPTSAGLKGGLIGGAVMPVPALLW